jgi:hypothetical protein
MDELSNRLGALGDALEAAARADLTPRRRRGPIRTRRLAVVLAALAVAIPSGAFAAVHFLSNGDVAASLPAGVLELVGTRPTCTTVRQGVEYHCTIPDVPAGAAAAGLTKGAVYETVDASHHVNGGCRALDDDATEWECYVGQAAVDQKIISQGFLGQVAGPSVG